MKFFIKKLCDHNLCIECLTSCSENLCVVDSKPLNIPDGFDLKSIKKRKCELEKKSGLGDYLIHEKGRL